MTTYDVLVSDELLAEFTNDNNTQLPEGFRIVGPVEGPSGYRSTRVRVEDDNAPAWTAGRLVTPTFTVKYTNDGTPVETSVTAYELLDEEAVRIASAVQNAEENPGKTFEVDK